MQQRFYSLFCKYGIKSVILTVKSYGRICNISYIVLAFTVKGSQDRTRYKLFIFLVFIGAGGL